MPTSSRLIAFVMLGAGALAACGGNNNNNGADARVTDANKTPDAPGTPDANVQVRDGTLAVTQVTLTDPGVTTFSGSSISLAFQDLTKEDGGMVVFGTGGIGECTVVQFDAGAGAVHKPHPPVDEGAITILGTGIKQNVTGTNPPSIPCSFQGGQYVCPVAAGTGVSGTYSASSAGGALLTVTGHNFSTTDIGSWISLSGFPSSSGLPGTNGMNGLFPIISVAGATAQLGVPANTAADAANMSFTAVDFTQLQGIGPVPGGTTLVDFIDTGSGSDHVEIKLAGNTDYPTQIDSTLSPIGRGMILDGPGTGCTDCAQPHQFPKSAAGSATVSFSVDPANGDKTGNAGELGDQLSVGMVVTGSTTDATIPGGAPPYYMPSPISSYATFSCLFPVAKTVQIPNGAIAAILATNPHRIETRVFRFAFSKGQDAATLSTWATVSGHGLVGHTDIP
jgi:hypothetical protein